MNSISTRIGIPLLVVLAVFAAAYFLFSLEMALMAAGAAAALVLIVFLVRRRRGGDAEETPESPASASSETAVYDGMKLHTQRRRNTRHQVKTGKLAKQLAAWGFVNAGFFRAKKQGLYVEGMANPGMNAYAVIYDSEQTGAWVEILTPYQDGGSYCVTAAPAQAVAAPRDPKMRVLSMTGQSVRRMIDRMLDERPAGEFDIVEPEDFKEYFEEYQRRGNEWVAERGLELQELEEGLRAAFLAANGMTEEEYAEDADSYFFVHDQLDVGQVAARLGIGDGFRQEGDTPLRLVERVVQADSPLFAVAATLGRPAPAYVLLTPPEAEVDICEVENDAVDETI